MAFAEHGQLQQKGNAHDFQFKQGRGSFCEHCLCADFQAVRSFSMSRCTSRNLADYVEFGSLTPANERALAFLSSSRIPLAIWIRCACGDPAPCRLSVK